HQCLLSFPTRRSSDLPFLDDRSRFVRRSVSNYDNCRQVRTQGFGVIVLNIIELQRSHRLRRLLAEARIVLWQKGIGERAFRSIRSAEHTSELQSRSEL